MLVNVLIIVACAHIISAESHDEDIHTVQYNDDNFATEVAKKNHFVMFYAPWCGHCQRLSPTWEQLAEMLNEDDSDIRIAKVDCTTDNKLCSEQDVTGYPTLKFFKFGIAEGVKFRGTRDLPTLTNFINEQIRSEDDVEFDFKLLESANKLVELTEKNFDEVLESGKNFVKFYAPWCGHCQKLAPTWEQLAQSLEFEPSVGISKIDCTQYKPLCAKFDVNTYPSLLWIEDGKKIEKYQGSRTHEDLKDFVNKMMGSADQPQEIKQEKDQGDFRTTVGVLTGSNFQDGIGKGVTVVKFFAPWCGHCKRLAPTWEELGKQFSEMKGVHVMQVDCTLHHNRKLCSEQEVEGFPTIYIYRDGRKVAEYTGSRNLNDLYKFVMKHLPRDEL